MRNCCLHLSSSSVYMNRTIMARSNQFAPGSHSGLRPGLTAVYFKDSNYHYTSWEMCIALLPTLYSSTWPTSGTQLQCSPSSLARSCASIRICERLQRQHVDVVQNPASQQLRRLKDVLFVQGLLPSLARVYRTPRLSLWGILQPAGPRSGPLVVVYTTHW